jgi:hypothetical protein
LCEAEVFAAWLLCTFSSRLQLFLFSSSTIFCV